MHPLRFCRALPLLPVIALLVAACSTTTDKKSSTVSQPNFSLDDTLSLQGACTLISEHLCSILRSGDGDPASLAFFNNIIDSTAGAINTSLRDKKNRQTTLDSIRSVVYQSWKIRFDPADTLIETLLPHLVFRNRKGACLGVSLIILMLAEKLNCPVYGVILPEHLFCRYDDGVRRINIEPNKEGCAHPDEYYRSCYPLEHRPWYSLSNLDNKAVIGILCHNAGVLCLKQKKYDAAILYCRECLRRIPGFVEAKGNCALVYAQMGRLDTALVLFEELFTAHPDLVNLAANYGTVAMAAKQYPKALDIFRKGLEYFPADQVLGEKLKKVCFILKLKT
jgi:regulator of sirC expression with transglutaminase-like and TPR domain